MLATITNFIKSTIGFSVGSFLTTLISSIIIALLLGGIVSLATHRQLVKSFDKPSTDPVHIQTKQIKKKTLFSFAVFTTILWFACFLILN